MNNTKARSIEIQTAARALLVERAVDITQRVDYAPLIKELVARVGCHPDTAKRHVGTAARRARGEESALRWGGARAGAGRPRCR